MHRFVNCLGLTTQQFSKHLGERFLRDISSSAFSNPPKISPIIRLLAIQICGKFGESTTLKSRDNMVLRDPFKLPPGQWSFVSRCDPHGRFTIVLTIQGEPRTRARQVIQRMTSAPQRTPRTWDRFFCI